ncbi:uncharacterized protein [Procambarus clarkii]|uniref:uncharacterized protein isoform X2 n=1 Tax=Procambarus clarkii TaxID=6728 RepID=UPI003743D372
MKLAKALALLAALVALAAADCDLPYCKIVAGVEVRCNDPQAWFEYHPHPTDRHLFIQCTTYGPQVMSCAPGTAWNQEASVCVHDTAVPSCSADVGICDCDKCFMADPLDKTCYYACSAREASL